MIVGLAGRSCAGKNQVARILEEKGWDSLDMDLMAHDILEELSPRAAELFGQDILDSRGRADRKKLGPLVFADPEKLKILEDLLYPELQKKLETLLAARKESDPPVILNAAALEKSRFWENCDALIWVHSCWIRRLYRAWKRDRKPLKELFRRFQAQRQLKPQYFFHKVDTYIIKNDGTRKALNNRIDRWLASLPPE